MSDKITDVRTWWAEPDLVDGWLALLEPGERDRFEAYQRPVDKARFLTGTVIVRHVYSAYLGISPAEVRLVRHCPDCGRPHGKVRGPGRLDVSVSHSGNWVIVAACADHGIGVDVEQVDPALDYSGVATLVATDDEIARLTSARVPGATAFTRLWTRKEAVLKALGEGLRTPMRDFTVSVPGETAAVVSWPSRPDLPGRLRLQDLDAGAGYSATVAVLDAQGPLRVLRYAASDLWSDSRQR
jgi:4'-phosphopantetheinyl transferase